MMEEDERQWIAGLETKGLVRVKSELKEYPPRYVHITAYWISEKEKESERQREALQSEQLELMKRDTAAVERQADAVERANGRATVAIWIAIASLLVSVFSSSQINSWLAKYWLF
jgi:hypothetical protein